MLAKPLIQVGDINVRIENARPMDAQQSSERNQNRYRLVVGEQTPDHDTIAADGGAVSVSGQDVTLSYSAQFLALKPSEFNSLVHSEEFNDTSWFQTPDTDEGYLAFGGPPPGCGGSSQGANAGMCISMAGGDDGLGGRLTAFNLKDFLIDSIANGTGMWSPPWVHEIVYWPGMSGGGVLNHRLDMDEGNGPGVASSLTRTWIAWLECWEGASGGCGPGVADFPMNDQGTKGLFINPGGGQHIFDWFGTWVITGNITDPVTGCPHLVANNMGADTLNYPKFGPQPQCVNVGDTGNQFGQWVERWICWDTSGGGSNGVVAFGEGSTIWGYHTGVSTSEMGAITHIRLTTNWGGGGNKSGTHSRWYDHMEVYTGSSGSCPSPS